MALESKVLLKVCDSVQQQAYVYFFHSPQLNEFPSQRDAAGPHL